MTLVHGTRIFGTSTPGAAWTKPDSPLCKALKQRLGENVVFDVFEWSGWKSHRARLKAASQLAEHLRKNRAHHPGVPHFLIGHSHGGNVIRYAMKDAEVARSITGVVTMSTPFIFAEPRPFGLMLRSLLKAFVIEAIVLSCIVAALSTVYGAYIISGSDWDRALRLLQTGNGAYVLPLIAFIYFSVRELYLNWTGAFLRAVEVRLAHRQEQFLGELDPPVIDRLPVLTIIPKADEAGRLLNVAYGSSEWLFTAFSSSTLKRIITFFVIPSALSYLMIRLMFGPPSQVEDLFVVFVVFFIGSALLTFLALPIPMLIYLLIIIFVPRVVKAPIFGEEGFIENWIVDIKQSPLPERWTPNENYTVLLPRPRLSLWTSLRHSLVYKTPEVVDRITNWLVALRDRPPDLSATVYRREQLLPAPLAAEEIIERLPRFGYRDGGPLGRIAAVEVQIGESPKPSLTGFHYPLRLICLLLLATLTIAPLLQAISRVALDAPLGLPSGEIARYSLIGLTFLGASCAGPWCRSTRMRGVQAVLPPRLRRYLQVLIEGASVLVFGIFMGAASLMIAGDSYGNLLEPNPSIRIPLWGFLVPALIWSLLLINDTIETFVHTLMNSRHEIRVPT